LRCGIINGDTGVVIFPDGHHAAAAVFSEPAAPSPVNSPSHPLIGATYRYRHAQLTHPLPAYRTGQRQAPATGVEVRTALPSGVRSSPVQSDAACTESGEIVRRGFASGGAAEALSSVEKIVPSLARHTEDGSGGRGRRRDGRQTVNIARKLMEGLTAEFAVGLWLR